MSIRQTIRQWRENRKLTGELAQVIKKAGYTGIQVRLKDNCRLTVITNEYQRPWRGAIPQNWRNHPVSHSTRIGME